MIGYERFMELYSPFPNDTRLTVNPPPDEEVKQDVKKERVSIFWRIMKQILSLFALILLLGVLGLL